MDMAQLTAITDPAMGVTRTTVLAPAAITMVARALAVMDTGHTVHTTLGLATMVRASTAPAGSRTGAGPEVRQPLVPASCRLKRNHQHNFSFGAACPAPAPRPLCPPARPCPAA